MKKLLSLALVLALCLSLAVPALAANAVTYDNGTVQITNVIDKGSLETDYSGLTHVGYITRSCVCGAPTTITPNSAKFGSNPMWFIAITPENLPEDGDVSDLDWDTYDGYTGASLTLTEPGRYTVGAESIETGEMFNLSIEVRAAAEIAPPAPVVGPTTNNKFTDVKAGDWFYDAVLWAVEKEITTGTTATTFSPYNTCTEAQILTFLWRAKGSPEPKNPVPSDTYFAKAAKWAVEQGIVDEFEADAPCTRAMTVEFLWKAAGKPNSSAKPAFTDVEGDGDLAQAVAWAVEKGITTGTSETTFTPAQICSRGQIVTFLYRNLK